MRPSYEPRPSLAARFSWTEQVIEYLYSEFVTLEDGCEFMAELKANAPELCAAVLCRIYDVAVYNVGESCFVEEAPVEDHDKFFVSLPALSDMCGKLDAIPLAQTHEQAELLAVEHLGLYQMFMATAPALELVHEPA